MAKPKVMPRVSTVVKTLEVSMKVCVGEDEEEELFRLVILKDSGGRLPYHVRGYRSEMFRIQPTFPQDPEKGEPAHEPCDEDLFVRDGWLEMESLRAGSLKEIERMAIRRLREKYQ